MKLASRSYLVTAALIGFGIVIGCTTPQRQVAEEPSRGLASALPRTLIIELEERLIARLVQLGAKESEAVLRRDIRESLTAIFSKVDKRPYGSFDDLVRQYEDKSFAQIDDTISKLKSSEFDDAWKGFHARFAGVNSFDLDYVYKDIRGKFSEDLRMKSVKTRLIDFKPKSSEVVENPLGRELRDSYFSGKNVLVVHGQTNELQLLSYGGKDLWISVEEQVSKISMSGRDLTVVFDLTEGLRFVTKDASGKISLQQSHPLWVEWLAKKPALKKALETGGIPKQPGGLFPILHEFFKDVTPTKKIGLVIDRGQNLLGRSSRGTTASSSALDAIGEGGSTNAAIEEEWLEKFADEALQHTNGKGLITAVITHDRKAFDGLIKRSPHVGAIEVQPLGDSMKSRLIAQKFRDHPNLRGLVEMDEATLAKELSYMNGAEIDLYLNEIATKGAKLSRSSLAEETGRRVAAYSDGTLKYAIPKNRKLADWKGTDNKFTREAIQETLDALDAGRLDDVALNTFLLGLPGNGKGELFGIIADELHRRGYATLHIGQYHGRYVGESEANMRKIFETSDRFKKVLLIMDEADMKLGSGVAGKSESSEQANAILFEELAKEEYAGKRLFLAASSRGPSGNLENMASAADLWRRFDVVLSTFVARTPEKKKELLRQVLIARKVELDVNQIPDAWYDHMSLRVASDFVSAVKLAKRRAAGKPMTKDILLQAIADTPAKHAESHILKVEAINAQACGLVYDTKVGVVGKTVKKVVCDAVPHGPKI